MRLHVALQDESLWELAPARRGHQHEREQSQIEDNEAMTRPVEDGASCEGISRELYESVLTNRARKRSEANGG